MPIDHLHIVIKILRLEHGARLFKLKKLNMSAYEN